MCDVPTAPRSFLLLRNSSRTSKAMLFYARDAPLPNLALRSVAGYHQFGVLLLRHSRRSTGPRAAHAPDNSAGKGTDGLSGWFLYIPIAAERCDDQEREVSEHEQPAHR